MGRRPDSSAVSRPIQFLVSTSDWSYVAAAALALISAVLAAVGGRLTAYPVLDVDNIDKLLSRDWGDRAATARSKIAQFDAKTIRHLRAKLRIKSNVLSAASLFGGLALGALLLALILTTIAVRLQVN